MQKRVSMQVSWPANVQIGSNGVGGPHLNVSLDSTNKTVHKFSTCIHFLLLLTLTKKFVENRL